MNKIIYAMAAAMVICISMAVYSGSAAEDLRENVTRLHIIANSDSEADQAVKIKVRDAILAKAREGEAVNTEDFRKTAEDTLRENGFTYAVRAETGEFYFPAKSYKDLTFPAGEYNGLRIILGEGEGKNWWCVMNPPLCFTENADGEMSTDGQEKLENALNDETYEIITEKPEIRFKIVEIFGELKGKK